MGKKKPKTNLEQITRIKTLVVIALFSDDTLMERLVLKGGNAIDLIHGPSSRASVDIDMSMAGEFSAEELIRLPDRIKALLRNTFGPEGYEVFDVEWSERPPEISEELRAFWGGYKISFKLIGKAEFERLQNNVEDLRRKAVKIGAKGKFEIDISRYEFCEGKSAHELDGLRIFVYSPAMIVCEKLRAICQQMIEYGPVVKRERAGSARARDFVDIHALMVREKLEMGSPENRQLLTAIFAAKHVPLDLLDRLEDYREFHRSDFESVIATVKPGVKLRDFDFYFDFVRELCRLLKAAGNM